MAGYQDKLPSDRTAVNVSLYCDGTQLNSFGTKKACGVYLWINNYPKDIRMSRTKKGGAILIGYLPEVSHHQQAAFVCSWNLRLQENLPTDHLL